MSLWAPPAEIWIWWSVSFYFQSFPSYWFGYYKRISLWHRALLSHVDGVLILFAKLWWLPSDPVQWEIRSCLDTCDDTWGSKWWLTNCDHSRSEDGVRGRFYVCNSWAAGGSVALSPVGLFCWVHAEIFELPSLLKLKESRYRRGAGRLICEGLRVVFIFNLAPFSLCPSQHTASPPSFAKSQLRAVLKARSGSEVTLECKPQASPPAISLWKKGNEILQRTER